MLETLIPVATRPLTQPELRKYIPTDLRDIITNVHPHLRGTGLPEVATKLFLALKPLTRHDQDQYNLPESFGLIRGSLIKRYLLGTPKGFLNIPEFFQGYNQTDELKKSQSNLTKNVSHKLAEGPVEIDGRFVFIKGREKQILHILKNSLISQGYNKIGPKDSFFTNGTFNAKIETIVIDKGTNQEKYLYQVKFYDKDNIIFNIDIFGLPDESKYPHELRLSFTSSFFEMESTAEMTMKEDSIIVMVDPSLTKTHFGPTGAQITASQESSTDAFGHILRLLGGVTFWPFFRNEQLYSLERIYQQLDNAILTRDNDDLIVNRFHNFSKERKRLKERQETLVSDLLLYMTYDPFLFLYLGFETHLFDHTMLGNFLKTEEDLSKLIKLMARELIGSDADGNISLPYLSHVYKKFILEGKPGDVKKTGGFMLLRAINNFNGENPTLPEALDNVVEILNPYLKYFSKN